ncbi:MAG: type II toxin-antitoxin system VapC family toxin [Haloarculaceae archaeon]
MTVFVDSGVFYAQVDREATRHDSATAALDAVLDGRYGQPITSDYVYDETVTLTLARTSSHELATTVGQRLRGGGDFTRVVKLHHVTPTVFETAVDVFERYDDQRLSFTDATTIALVEAEGLDCVLSFDDDFDGIVDRLDPAEA